MIVRQAERFVILQLQVLPQGGGRLVVEWRAPDEIGHVADLDVLGALTAEPQAPPAPKMIGAISLERRKI